MRTRVVCTLDIDVSTTPLKWPVSRVLLHRPFARSHSNGIKKLLSNTVRYGNGFRSKRFNDFASFRQCFAKQISETFSKQSVRLRRARTDFLVGDYGKTSTVWSERDKNDDKNLKMFSRHPVKTSCYLHDVMQCERWVFPTNPVV